MSGISKRKMIAVAFFLLSTALGAAGVEPARGIIIPDMKCLSSGRCSYALYLPASYDSAISWPIIYCFDPLGRGALPVEIFLPAAEKYGYILAGSNDFRNGPLQDCLPGISAMVQDTRLRFAIDGRRIYTAGYSGGAEMALAFAATTSIVPAGVIANSNFLPSWMPAEKLPASVAVFAYAGTLDFNYWLTRDLYELCRQRGMNCRLLTAAEDHRWLSPENALEAVAWLELQAGKNRSKELAAAWLQEQFLQRQKAITALPAIVPPGERLAAYQSFINDFSAWHDVSLQKKELADWQASAAYRNAKNEETELRAKEKELLASCQANISQYLQASDIPSRKRLLHSLNISGLAKLAEANNDPAAALAKRLLAGFCQRLTISGREQLQNGNVQQAIAAFELAAQFQPQRSVPRFYLAVALCRNGEKKLAWKSLRAAVDLGWQDAALIENEEGLQCLRKESKFQELLVELKKKVNLPNK